VAATGLYRDARAYEGAHGLPFGDRCLVVDFSGDRDRIAALRGLLGRRVVAVVAAGYTHAVGDAPAGRQDAWSGRFFAPAEIQRRVREWGAARFDRLLRDELRRFRIASLGWFRTVRVEDPEAVVDAYGSLYTGGAGGMDLLVAYPSSELPARLRPAAASACGATDSL